PSLAGDLTVARRSPSAEPVHSRERMRRSTEPGTDPDESLRVLDRELDRGLALIAGATSADELRSADTAVFGRKSAFSSVQRSLGTLPEDARREVGRRTNEVR